MKPLPLGIAAYREAVEQLLAALPMNVYEFDAWGLTHQFPLMAHTPESVVLPMLHDNQWAALMSSLVHYHLVVAPVEGVTYSYEVAP